jgi:hypothetical protein
MLGVLHFEKLHFCAAFESEVYLQATKETMTEEAI